MNYVMGEGADVLENHGGYGKVSTYSMVKFF